MAAIVTKSITGIVVENAINEITLHCRFFKNTLTLTHDNGIITLLARVKRGSRMPAFEDLIAVSKLHVLNLKCEHLDGNREISVAMTGAAKLALGKDRGRRPYIYYGASEDVDEFFAIYPGSDEMMLFEEFVAVLAEMESKAQAPTFGLPAI